MFEGRLEEEVKGNEGPSNGDQGMKKEESYSGLLWEKVERSERR